MEVGQRPLAQVRFWNTNPKFQTLLSWKSVSGYCLRAFCQPQEVSNLVVMEVGQRRRSAASALLIGYCVSNLVVMEVGQRHAVAPFMGDNITEFQTLLSWKSVSGFNAMRRSAIALKVSNLVVMEVGQRHQAFSGIPVSKHVSNLVVMEVGQRLARSLQGSTPSGVSNLVVMEVGQRLSWV